MEGGHRNVVGAGKNIRELCVRFLVCDYKLKSGK